jgi:TPR repeat protein
MDGRGTKKNLACAETWLQAAARQGNKRAKMLLDCL